MNQENHFSKPEKVNKELKKEVETLRKMLNMTMDHEAKFVRKAQK